MSHFNFNDGTKYGGMVRTMLNLNESGDGQARHLRGTLSQMIAGDGSQDANYAEIKTAMGFATDVEARAWWSEFDSFFGKTSGNGSVTNVRAARDQFYDQSR